MKSLLMLILCIVNYAGVKAQSNSSSVITIYRPHEQKLDKHYLYLSVYFVEIDSLPAGCRLNYTVHDEGPIHLTGIIKSYPDWPSDKIDITSVPQDTTFIRAVLSRDAFGNVKLKFSAVARVEARSEIASMGNTCVITKSDVDDAATSDITKTGTGFLISNNGLLVTNYHVIENAKKITVKSKEWSVEATLIAQDMDNDIVLLKLPDTLLSKIQAVPFNIRNVQADIGEAVSVFGYPLTNSMGEDVKLTTGIVSSVNGYKGNANSYQITAPVQPGNSGGPVFDEKANLIGVVNAKHVLAENATYAIKSTYLVNFLQSVPEYIAPLAGDGIINPQLVEQAKMLQKIVFLIEVQ